jgi:hypothetical protein
MEMSKYHIVLYGAGIILQVLVAAIFVSAMFFFSMAVGRAATPNWDDLKPVGPEVTAYLLTFKIINTIPFVIPPKPGETFDPITGTAKQISYVSIPGIATKAECVRLAEAMLTDPDRQYVCNAYQMAH